MRFHRYLFAAVPLVVALSPLVERDEVLAQETPPCDAVQVEYALSANLELSDTPMGKGDGTYPIGPGRALLRYEQRDGAATGAVKMVGYEMTEKFKIDSSAVFWKAHVKTDSKTTVLRDACGVVSTGSVSGRTLTWSSDIRGARSDGKISCDGSLCGKFGAPPSGTSALHVPPHDVRFKPWVFGPDMKTFTMERAWMSHSDDPKQTAFVALAGREVRRGCVTVPACTP